jgi:hypothetical protein
MTNLAIPNIIKRNEMEIIFGFTYGHTKQWVFVEREYIYAKDPSRR